MSLFLSRGCNILPKIFNPSSVQVLIVIEYLSDCEFLVNGKTLCDILASNTSILPDLYSIIL
jgi:hypothetical protein